MEETVPIMGIRAAEKIYISFTVHLVLAVFFFIPGIVYSQASPEKNLQQSLENLDTIFTLDEGTYRGKYSVISGQKIRSSSFILYSRGNDRAYHFFSNSHDRYAVLLLTEKWYFFDILRKKKILLENHLRKESAGEIGFSPALLSASSFEKKYEPEKSIPLAAGRMRIFIKGLLPESYRRISIELDGTRPVLMDLYNDSDVIFQTLRYEYRNEMRTPKGETVDRINFPDHQELIDLTAKVIYRMTYYEYDSKIPDEKYFLEKKGGKETLYAPQADHSSLSR